MINSFLNKVEENFKISNFQFELLAKDENGNVLVIYKYFKKDNILMLDMGELNTKMYRTYIGNNTFEGLTVNEENKEFFKDEIITEKDVTVSGEVKANYPIIERVKYCFTWKIKNEQINGKDCIVITDENGDNYYYDKETAYLIERENGGEIVNIKLNTVTDEDVQIPNLENYTEIGGTIQSYCF